MQDVDCVYKIMKIELMNATVCVQKLENDGDSDDDTKAEGSGSLVRKEKHDLALVNCILHVCILHVCILQLSPTLVH